MHKESIDIAVAEETGEVRHQGRIGGDMNALSRAVRKLEALGRVLVFVYEAGPCGFGIYRALRARGHECWVVAPSNTPRRVRDRIKTDHRDSMKLAGLARAGELSAIYVPDPADEAMRDLDPAGWWATRECSDVMLHRVHAVVQRHGEQWPEKSQRSECRPPMRRGQGREHDMC